MPRDPIGALSDLLDASSGAPLPLPTGLAQLYGTLRFPDPHDAPHIVSNFVTSLDGVVSLGEPRTGGAEISGGSREDRMVMALLRAASDVVIVGAGTLRAFPRHLWTPEAIDSERAADYAELRRALGKTAAPTTVLVTASGAVDLSLPVFASASTVVVTTDAGAQHLARAGRALDVRVAGRGPSLGARDILDALPPLPGARILLEGGPRLMATFLEARAVDELFLTVSPQVMGRTPGDGREGLVSGARFFPHRPVWAHLAGVKSGGNLLFLRYRLPRT